MLEDKVDSHSNPYFETRKQTILEIWDQMQRLQTDFALAQELTFYYTSSQWHSADTVLDIGTGNGYYLRKIASRFPRKAYHGVDVSAELIAIAAREAGSGNVSFSQRDLFEVTESYDFVLMRLLFQHLGDIQAVLNHVATLTGPGKAALIIDACDALRSFHPALPEFMEFFTAYAEHERKVGRDRHVSNRVEQVIASSTAWQLGSTVELLIPSTIPGNLELFTKTYTLLLDLVEQAGEFQYDFSAVKEAWRQWSERPDAYTQVGLNLIRIDRI